MTEETLRDIRSRYPNITGEELKALSPEEWNKCSIALLEGISIDYKNQLQDLFKNSKKLIEDGVSLEDIDWLKEYLRDCKNSVESQLKERVLEQQYLRGGLNSPWCYKHKEA
jgi:transcriptional antiterminator